MFGDQRRNAIDRVINNLCRHKLVISFGYLLAIIRQKKCGLTITRIQIGANSVVFLQVVTNSKSGGSSSANESSVVVVVVVVVVE